MTTKPINKMPSIQTLRKYYPNTSMTDQELLDTAEWVRVYSNKAHISPDNKVLAGIIAIHEARPIGNKVRVAKEGASNE